MRTSPLDDEQFDAHLMQLESHLSACFAQVPEAVAGVSRVVIFRALAEAAKSLRQSDRDRSSLQVDQKEDASPVTDADRSADGIIRRIMHESHPDLVLLTEEEVSLHAQAIPHLSADRTVALIDPLDGTKEFLTGSGEYTVNIGLVRRGGPIAGGILCPQSGEFVYGECLCSGEEPSQQGKTLVSSGLGNVSVLESSPGSGLRKKRADPRPLRVFLSASHRALEENSFVSLDVPYQILRVGSSLKFCRLLAGEGDIYLRLTPSWVWDTAAGQAALLAAGGGVVSLSAIDGIAVRGGELSYARPVSLSKPLINPGFLAWRPGLSQEVVEKLQQVLLQDVENG